MGAQQVGFAPMPAVALVLSRYDRATLGSFIEVAIGLMDVADGDENIEPNGDEQDCSGAAEEDTPEIDTLARGFGNPEDAEEDDEDCGTDEGEPDYRHRRRHRRGQGGAGCSISDQDFGAEEIGEQEYGTTATYGIDQTKGPFRPQAH